MHASKDARGPRYLEGLHYSFAILDDLRAGLHSACIAIEKDPRALLPPALWRCWSIIDFIHRIRELAQGLPGLSHKNSELADFLEKTKLAEDFRHYIQHLRRELSRVPATPSPVWGSLSWVDQIDPLLSHTAIFGVMINGVAFPSSVFDREERRWVSRVTLATPQASFNFDPTLDDCDRFRAFVLPWAARKYGLDPSQHAINPFFIHTRAEVASTDPDKPSST